MKYEILDDSGNVINTIEADEKFMKKNYDKKNYRESAFEPIVESRPRHITVGAFFDRFGSKKYAILEANDAGIQARIKDASVRKYIDLNDPKVLEDLTYLQASKHAVDPTTVLNPPVREEERP